MLWCRRVLLVAFFSMRCVLVLVAVTAVGAVPADPKAAAAAMIEKMVSLDTGDTPIPVTLTPLRSHRRWKKR